MTAEYLKPLADAIGASANTAELGAAILDFIEAQEKLTTMQRLQQAFASGEKDALFYLVVDVLVSHKEVTGMWRHPGEPSITDYARQLVSALKRRYSL